MNTHLHAIEPIIPIGCNVIITVHLYIHMINLRLLSVELWKWIFHGSIICANKTNNQMLFFMCFFSLLSFTGCNVQIHMVIEFHFKVINVII